jgi:hypothetical protein
MFVRAALAAFLMAVGVLLTPRAAHAWVDVTIEGDDVRVAVDKGGDARVEHKITLKIAGGPLRSLDLKGVDADAVPDPDGYVVPQREAARGSLASAQGVAAERVPDDGKLRDDGSPSLPVMRIRFDPDCGLGRGVYVLLVRYTTKLGSRIVVNGAFSRITWRGVVWESGFDSARVTFELPAAPNEPRADDAPPAQPSDPQGTRSPLVLTKVRRGPMKDQIELLRPYAPKGEAITWAIRADARAFRPADAAPLPSAPKAAPSLHDPAQRAVLLVGALSLFILYASLVALKSREVARLAKARGVEPRALVPIPSALRALFGGAALVAGVIVELVLMRATIGATLVLAAVLFAAHRAPLVKRAALRGPGRWLPIAASIALKPPPRPKGAYLDSSTRAGKALLILALAAVFGAAALLYDTSPFRAELIAFDAVVVLAIFGTGRLVELPPDPATSPVATLREVARLVQKRWPASDLRIVGKIRVPDGSSDPDELRLSIAPRSAPIGFGAIEVGVVHAIGAGGSFACPEVILRVTTGSPCEEALAKLARHGRSSRGRKKTERAILLTPRLPTARMTAAMVLRLMQALSDARRAKPARAPSKRAA